MYATFEWNDMNGRYTRPFSFFGWAIAIGRPYSIAARNRIPVWVGFNKKGIGIHGIDSPDMIGRSASHGCIRLANWDAARVVNQVTTAMIDWLVHQV